ncbi:hypothetical protein DL96DRAFT_1759993 [Flagelloscypha sp. PMI_526]|nr:hypothetical protein DL96DRAFT_1759993 [Flagelloscypha sp. PMI_526]
MSQELSSYVDFVASTLHGHLNSPNALRELYRNHKTIIYCDVSAFWLMLYDYCISFGLERSVIWTSRWNSSKVLYLLTRYTVFVVSALELTWMSVSGGNVQLCGPLLITLTSKSLFDSTVLIFLIQLVFRCSGMAFAGAIFTLRTIAVFNRSKRFNFILFALYGLFFAAGIVFMVIFARANAHGSLRLPNEWPGCMLLARAPRKLLVGFILVLVFETIVCVMMLWHGFTHYRVGIARVRLIRVIYQDAVVFYVTLLMVSIANVVTLAIPGAFTYAITHFQLVLHSVLACRVILHIREEAQPPECLGNEESLVLAAVQTFGSSVPHSSAATSNRDITIIEGE